MATLGLSVLILVCISIQYTTAYIEALAGNIEVPATPSPEPQVAMICNEKSSYHNKYLSVSGKWVNDLDTKAKCLNSKSDILKYCQKVYHDREIVNIVEASEVIKLTDWCKVDHRKCKGSHWVKPYRCLEGVFQSDALLVPDTCQFNHLHNETQCKSYGEWDSTARRNCIQHSMQLQSVGMLLPCGIDVFRGVEFVCCPNSKEKETEPAHHQSTFGEEKKEVSQHLDNDDEEYLDDDDEYLDDEDDEEYDDDDDYEEDEESSEEEKTPAPTADPYFTHFDARNEHRDFKDAQERMEKHHREKITTVMKDWADLEERYQEMRNKDAKKAETFRKKMTLKFQDTVHALETEVDGEKHQLNVMHQQRVLAHINQRKKEAMGCYTKALNQHPPNGHQVEKCLQKLLRALHKDRHHTISHYRHLLNSEFSQAEAQKDVVVQHLNTIDKEVNQSLNMLNRYPSLSRKMVPLMKEYVSALRARDSTPAALLPVNHENEEKLVDQYRDQAQHKLKIKQKAKIAEEARKAEKMKAHREKKLSSTVGRENMIHEEVEPEQLVHHTLQQIQIHHVKDSGLSHQASQFSVVRESVSTTSQSVYVSLAFAGVALMAALVVGMLILRRRNARSPQAQGFVEVDQSVSPEERHVNNMQVNGYENPTYKYFEAHDT